MRREREVCFDFRSHIVPICSVSLSKDNQCIVASTTSSSVLCFERASGLLLNELEWFDAVT